MKSSKPHIGMKTPWGKADHVTQLAEGLYSVSTPSHGGLKLSTKLNSQVHEAVRSKGGWYEEDIAYLWVCLTFPELIEKQIIKGSLDGVHQALRDQYPDRYEAVLGQPLQPNQSRRRREDLFRKDHASDWIVVSASGDWHPKVPKGMVGVYCNQASMARKPGARTRCFLVPASDYSADELQTPIGFICDPSPSPNAPYEEIEKF